jgi:hypothetical protein
LLLLLKKKAKEESSFCEQKEAKKLYSFRTIVKPPGFESSQPNKIFQLASPFIERKQQHSNTHCLRSNPPPPSLRALAKQSSRAAQ